MGADPVAAGQAAWEAQKAALLDYVSEPAHLRTLVGVFREISSLQAAERRAEVARQEAAARHQRQRERLEARIADLEAALAPLAALDLEMEEDALRMAGLEYNDVRQAQRALRGKG